MDIVKHWERWSMAGGSRTSISPTGPDWAG